MSSEAYIVAVFALGAVFGAVLVFSAIEVKSSREAKRANDFLKSQSELIAKVVIAQRKAEADGLEPPDSTGHVPGKEGLN
jgi:hypothetical protein